MGDPSRFLSLPPLGPPWGYGFAAVWGAAWGSFFNVAIHRLADGESGLRSLLGPPSHCPSCRTPIPIYDNVPVLSWLWLRGRCRSCRVRIPIRYPLVELLGIGAALLVYHRFVLGHPDALALVLCRFLVYFLFVGTLTVLSFIDLRAMLLP